MTVKPNQSLLDVILQGCGSLEAGMQVAADNGVAISDYPAAGVDRIISATAVGLGDKGVLAYIAQNGVVFGTLAIPPTYSELVDESDNPIMTEDGSDNLVTEDVID